MRERKIRRYGQDVRRRRQRRVLSVISTALIILAAAAAGWFLYPSVYQYYTSRDFSPNAPQSQQESSLPMEESLPESSGGEETHSVNGRYAYLPAAALTQDGYESLLSQLAAQGFEGVVLDLKNENGIITYNSSAAAGYVPQAVSEEAFDLAGVLGAAKRAGLTVSGRISAFRDPLGSRILYSSAVKYNYTEINWLDNSQAQGGKPWLNPNSSGAQSYIIALAEEAAVTGLERIILDGVQFPEGFSLNLATYGPESVSVNSSQVLADFIGQARQAVAQYGAELCFMTDISGVLGVSAQPFGEDIASVISAADRTVIDLSPAQFGSSFLFGGLALASPDKDPYNTVYSTLALASLPETKYTGWAQYSDAEQQIKAAGEYGIADFVLYDADGVYSG